MPINGLGRQNSIGDGLINVAHSFKKKKKKTQKSEHTHELMNMNHTIPHYIIYYTSIILLYMYNNTILYPILYGIQTGFKNCSRKIDVVQGKRKEARKKERKKERQRVHTGLMRGPQ